MPGPWENYQAAADSNAATGPWAKYAQQQQNLPMPYDTRGPGKYHDLAHYQGEILGGPVLPSPEAFIPSVAAVGINKLGNAIGLPDWLSSALGIATSVAAESPRLQGGAMGAAKGAATEASHGFHFLNPFAVGKGALKGAQEGMQGKLWLGDTARAVRDAFKSKPEPVTAPAGSMGQGVQAGFGPSPNVAPPPVEVGGAHIPNTPYIPNFVQPGEETEMFKTAPTYLGQRTPAGSLGQGAQAGFGPSPQMQPPPVDVGGAHIPNKPYVHPTVQPGEETQLFKAGTPHTPPKPTGSMGKGEQTGFGVKPKAPEAINKRSLPEGVNPPVVQPSPAEMAERIAASKKAEMEAATKPTTAAPPAPTAITPSPATAPVVEQSAAPGSIRTAQPHLDAKRSLFATGQELELPGSPAGTRATDYIKQHAQRIYGNSVSKLTVDQVRQMGEWLANHKGLEGMPSEAPATAPAAVAGPALEDQLIQSVDQARAERNARLGLGLGVPPQ